MDYRVPVSDLVKMGVKLISHKIVQYRLETKETQVICTNYGQMKGVRRKTIYDDDLYYAFEGIPYAKPPVGELRFRAPQPTKPWQGIRNCTYLRAKPVQKHMILGVCEGSEDCLYLNVYAKQLKTDRPLPVMVWIYGGGFQCGEASRDMYSPDYFMKHDVVLVTFNYRVGALGFLSLPDRDLDVPGNAGLKDQVMALQWVRANIAQFNGDENNITLFGESAGAASVQMMMSTEQTRGVFHKAIVMSGSSLNGWAMQRKSQILAYRLASRLGYKGTDNDKEIFRFLQRASPCDLAMQGSAVLSLEDSRELNVFPFTPVVEPYVTQDCVIPKPPVQMLAEAWGNDIPAILGGTSFEGLFSYQAVMADSDYMLSAFESALPLDVKKLATPAQLKEMTRNLKIFYFGDATRGRMDLMECLNLLSFSHFYHGVHRTVTARLAYAPATPTYLYRFDFDSPTFNHFRIIACGRNVRGTSHADDLSYMFYNIAATKLAKDSAEYATIERLTGMWTAFAASGDPNCPKSAPAVWCPLEPSGPRMCLNIGNDLEFIEVPERKQLKFWDSLYDELKLI